MVGLIVRRKTRPERDTFVTYALRSRWTRDPDSLRNERVLFLFFSLSLSSRLVVGITEVIDLFLVPFSLASFISLLACVDGC